MSRTGAKELALHRKAARHRPTAEVFRSLCLDNDPTCHQRKRFDENRTEQPTAWS
jgi:hypothetical protein